MSTVEHTTECLARDAERKGAYDAWTERWPNHCDHCRGVGAFYDPGHFYQPPSEDPCSSCTEVGLCARCGEPGLTDEERGDTSTGEGPCKACGWNYDDEQPRLREDPCECEEKYFLDEGIV